MKRDGDLKVLLGRLICWNLVGFDILLGGLSLLKPEFVLKLFSPSSEPKGATLLRRTGAIWLFFVPVQLWAALRTENPVALRAVAILRLQEVGADPVWLAEGEGFGVFGRFGLAFAPIFNLVVGAYLWLLARDLERRGRAVNL